MATSAITGLLGLYMFLFGLVPQQSTEYRKDPVHESRATYDRVMSHLEPGGDFLMILNAENGIKRTSEGLVGIVKAFGQAANTEGKPEVSAKITHISTELPAFLADNGLVSLKALGASVIPNGDGILSSRTFFLRDVASADKPFWQIFVSGAPRELVSQKYLPKGVALVVSTTGDPRAVLKLVEAGIDSLYPEAKSHYEQGLSQAGAVLGLDVKQAVLSIDTESFVAVTLDPSVQTSIPLDKTVCTIPEPSVLIGLRLRSPLIYNRIVKQLDAMSGAFPKTVTNVGDVEVRTVMVALPFGVSPSIAYNSKDGIMILGTHAGSVKAAISAGVLGTDRFVDSPAYREAAGGRPLPPNNGMTYVGKQLGETLWKLQTAALSADADTETAKLFERFFSNNSGFQISFIRNLPDGVECVSRGTRGVERYGSMLTTVPVATTGLLAAIAIPNFVQARTRSQENACVANLKQLEGAYEQAKLNGITNPKPSDLFGTNGYIRNEPVCPATKQHYQFDAAGHPLCPSGRSGHVLP